jgi:hypothetical protein
VAAAESAAMVVPPLGAAAVGPAPPRGWVGASAAAAAEAARIRSDANCGADWCCKIVGYERGCTRWGIGNRGACARAPAAAAADEDDDIDVGAAAAGAAEAATAAAEAEADEAVEDAAASAACAEGVALTGGLAHA